MSKSLYARRTCWNCRDVISDARKVALCPVCRRTYGVGGFVGGVIVALAGGVLKFWFHVL